MRAVSSAHFGKSYFGTTGPITKPSRLEAARNPLHELGAPEPEMPPFDPSKFEPMPEVEINPKDEFYVEMGENESA